MSVVFCFLSTPKSSAPGEGDLRRPFSLPSFYPVRFFKFFLFLFIYLFSGSIRQWSVGFVCLFASSLRRGEVHIVAYRQSISFLFQRGRGDAFMCKGLISLRCCFLLCDSSASQLDTSVLCVVEASILRRA
eukprot:gene1549-934_t